MMAMSAIAGTTKDRDRSKWLPGNAKRIYKSQMWPALVKEAKILEACDNTAHMLHLPL